MIELSTWGQRSIFLYSGNVLIGVWLRIGKEGLEIFIPAQVFEEIFRRFGGRTVPLGTSFDKPPPDSLGRFLLDHVSKTAVASYVGAILVHEGYAVQRGKNIEILGPKMQLAA